MSLFDPDARLVSIMEIYAQIIDSRQRGLIKHRRQIAFVTRTRKARVKRGERGGLNPYFSLLSSFTRQASSILFYLFLLSELSAAPHLHSGI